MEQRSYVANQRRNNFPLPHLGQRSSSDLFRMSQNLFMVRLRLSLRREVSCSFFRYIPCAIICSDVQGDSNMPSSKSTTPIVARFKNLRNHLQPGEEAL